MAIALADLMSSAAGPFSEEVQDYREKNVDSINSAQEAYGLSGFIRDGGFQQLNLPKLQFGFIIQFVLSDSATTFLEELYPGIGARHMSYVVKDCDLPSQTFDIQTVNQYNRTRVYPGKVAYNPINMAVYDTVDSSALKIYDAYRTWYNGDFDNKSIYNWEFNQVSSTNNFEENIRPAAPPDIPIPDPRGGRAYYQAVTTPITVVNPVTPDTKAWGRSVTNQGDLDEAYFFKRLDIIEIQDGTYTYHNIFNPVIASSTFETKSHESDGAPALINFTLQYEGVAHINPLTAPGWGTWDDKAIAKSGFELGSLMSISNMNGDRHFATELTLEQDAPRGNTAESVTGTALSSVSGATEAFGVPGVDAGVTNVGNAVSAGTDLADDATQSATNVSALGSIGGI